MYVMPKKLNVVGVRNDKKVGNPVAAQNIRRLRHAFGYTMKDLAEVAGVSEATICLLEAQRRHGRIGIFEKLSRAFGVELQDLFTPTFRPNGIGSEWWERW